MGIQMGSIVVGYVPTPEGAAAVDYAVSLSKADGRELVITNSGVRGNDAHPAFAPAGDWDTLDRQLTEQGIAHRMVQPLLADSPADVILDTAREANADLIVIGLRRRSPVGKLFLAAARSRCCSSRLPGRLGQAPGLRTPKPAFR